MSTTRRHTLFASLAAVHLALVACGAAGFAPWAALGPPGDAVRWYGSATEAGNGYGYFAPAVGMPSRVTLVLSDDAGRTWTDSLGHADNPEARLRMGTIAQSAADPRVRDAVTAAWAAKAFGRHPNATSVVVRIELYALPTMEGHKAGQPAGWEIVHEATFRRSAGEEK